MAKSILFVDDDANVLNGLRRMTRNIRKEWDLYFAIGGEEGLELLGETKVDFVISDMRMPKVDGATFLNEVARTSPNSVRFILSGEADRETTFRTIGPSHQFLSKPCSGERLTRNLADIANLSNEISERMPLDTALDLSTINPGPAALERLEIALRKGNLDSIGLAFLSDPILTLKVLQLVNSSYFGIGAQVQSPVQAASLLGSDLLSDLFKRGKFGAPDESTASGLETEFITASSVLLSQLSGRIANGMDPSGNSEAIATTLGLLLGVGETLANQASADQKSEFDQTSTYLGVFLSTLLGLPPTITEAARQLVNDNESASDTPKSPAALAVSAAQIMMKQCDIESPVQEVPRDVRNMLKEWQTLQMVNPTAA